MKGCCFFLLLLFVVSRTAVLAQPAAHAPRDQVLRYLENIYRSSSPDYATRRHVQALGTNAVPVLLEVLQYQRPQLHQWYDKAFANAPEEVQNVMSKVDAWGRLRDEAVSLLQGTRETPYYLKSIVALLQDTRPEIRRSAAKVVQNFGRDLTNKDMLLFLPALQDADPSVRAYIVSAIRNNENVLLPEAMMALEEALGQASEIERLGITATLLRADGNHPAALQTLKSMFTSGDAHSRFYAAVTYLHSNPSKAGVEDELLPIILNALSGSDESRRNSALYTIGRFGTRAKAAEPVLQKMLQAPELEIRQAATNALRSIAAPAPASREKILQLLVEIQGLTNQPYASSQRKVAFDNLSAMGTNAAPFLIEILGHRKSQTDQWYEQAYAKAPEAIRNAVSKPEALEKLRREAQTLLLNMRETPLYFSEIVALLQDERAEVRQRAASLLHGYAEKVSKVQLLECLPHLKDSDPSVRRSIALTLAHAVALPRVKAELEKTLSDPDENVRIVTATALLKADCDHLAALQTLKKLFGSPNLNLRFGAARAYLACDPYRAGIEELLPIFLDVLSGPDPNLYPLACHTLRTYTVRADAAVPVLLKHLQSPRSELQSAARSALERIAPEALPPAKP